MNRVSAIVCVDSEMGLGFNDKLLYKSPTDMAFFNGYTQGKIVVGGRKTMEGIKSLPNREMVVMTRDLSNIDQRNYNKYLAAVTNMYDLQCIWTDYDLDVVVIGGAEVYELSASRVEELFITELNIPLDELKEADSYFPITAYDHLVNEEIVFKNEELTIYRKW